MIKITIKQIKFYNLDRYISDKIIDYSLLKTNYIHYINLEGNSESSHGEISSSF